MLKGVVSQGFLLFVGFTVVSSGPVQAAEHYVTVDDSGFDPGTLPINVGDTVVWLNFDDSFSHTTTSDLPVLDPNYWNGFLFDFLDTFSKTFNTVGMFTYRDQLDIGVGVIVVGAGNVPPSVTITNPSADAVFTSPATFAIEASASDPDGGGVAFVEFFVDGNSLGIDLTEPYSASATDLAPGSHSLTAIATDNLGAQGTNSVSITVNPGNVSLRNPRLVGGAFLFDVTGLAADKTNLVQASANLTQWTPIRTNSGPDSSMTVTNARTAARLFYRVVQLP